MYNILVVDDDKEIVESIEIYLKNEGFKFVGPKTVLGFLHMVGIIQAKNVCIYK